MTLPVSRNTAGILTGSFIFVLLSAILAFLIISQTEVYAIRYTLYPVLWIGASLWVMLRRPPRSASQQRRYVSAVIALMYFLLLAIIGGLIQRSQTTIDPAIVWLSPGWGPAFFASIGGIQLAIIPFELIGYIALALLVYTILLSKITGAFAGLLGVITCVGCVWPVGVAIVAIVGGIASPLGTTVPGFAYDASTGLFLVTVAMLYWVAWRTV